MWLCTPYPRIATRSFLHKLERGKAVERARRMKEKMEMAAVT